MTTMNDTLPEDLVFQPDGHLTEVALTCAADGQLDILGALQQRAHDHLDDCERCAHLLGEAALLSVHAGESLRERPSRCLSRCWLPPAPRPSPCSLEWEWQSRRACAGAAPSPSRRSPRRWCSR